MKKKFALIIFFMIFIFINPQKAYAVDVNDPANPHYDTDGNVTWTTKDDKRSGYPYWETVGFTLRADECVDLHGGNPRYAKPYGSINLQSSWKIDIPMGNTGYTQTKFTIPVKVVSKAVEKAKVTPETLEKSRYCIYLNGIFKVHKSATKISSYIYTMNGIMYPSGVTWATPLDFRDRFDVPVPFDPPPQPVQIKYMETNHNYKTTIKTIKNSDEIWGLRYHEDANYTYEDGNGLDFASNSYPTLKTVNASGYSIPMKKSKIVNGVTEEYYLYRVHWSRLTDEEKDTATGKLRKARDTLTVSTNPNVDYEAYKAELDTIRHRSFVVVDGGIEIVAVYKKFSKYVDENDSTTISKDFNDPIVTASIDADYYDNRKFSAQDAIPTTETVFATVGTDQQTLVRYKFKKYSGTKYYKIKIIDKKATKEDPEEFHYEMVDRDYCYYTVEKLDIYTLDKAVVNNYCLPGGTTTISASNNIKIDNFSYRQYSGESGHLQEPEEGGEEVEPIKCRNDFLVINGKCVMDDFWIRNASVPPDLGFSTSINKNAPQGPGGCLCQSNLLIEALKTNGEYDSDGVLYYKNAAHIGSTSEAALEYEIEGINSVIIHTPTICDPLITDIRKYNQLIVPNQSCASLVLDRNFSVYFPTYGTHSDFLGYRTRGYAKYTAFRQLMFPFDIYIGKTFYPKDTWITITSDTTEFYLPIWVDEGDYTIDARSISINAAANNGIDQTEDLANYDYENYVAVDTIDVEVSGRVYGLQLYDISDYPTWENVFRFPNSLHLSGFNYSVGTRNQNGESTGRNPKYTLTLVNGSHPGYKNVGVIKTGYVTRFNLTTIGNMYSENDSVWIQPKFYYVDAKGNNRQEVDLYYSETFNGKKQNLVKAGSLFDWQNVKAYRLGDPYLTVPDTEIQTKATITGRSVNQIKGLKTNLLRFMNILIQNNMNTYIGANYTPTGSVPAGVDPAKVTKSMQKWYGEYYLPSEVHIAPKDFDVYEYARTHNGIDYKEAFWKKNGSIIVNFEIETIQDGERRLSYINASNVMNGYCNMWKLEGYQYNKTDFKGNIFNFKDGDYVMYDTDKSAAKDYISGGTH